MSRLFSQVMLLVMCFTVFGALIPARGQNLGAVLDGHDPKGEIAPNIETATQSQAPASGTPSAEPGKLTPDQFQKIYEKLLETLEKIAKILEGLLDSAGKVATGDKAKGGEGKRSKSVDGQYTVVPGDSLWKIAEQFLGSGSRYWELVEANKERYPCLLKNCNLIHPGWTLTIPGGGGGSTPGGSGKPGSSGGTSGGGKDPPAGTDPGGVASKVAQVAAGFPSRYNGRQKFPYAAGTEGGNLGCANVVSAVLKEAGVPVWSLSVNGVKDALLKLSAPKNWKIVRPPPYQPGDVVCWSPPPGGIHGHIGVVCKNGNSLQAMNNSSSQRKPIFSGIEHRKIACVLRKA